MAIRIGQIDNQIDDEGSNVFLQVQVYRGDGRRRSQDLEFESTTLPPDLTIDKATGVVSGKASEICKDKPVRIDVRSAKNPSNASFMEFKWTIKEKFDEGDTWFKLDVPDYQKKGNQDKKPRSYLRLGAADKKTETFIYNATSWQEWPKGEKQDYHKDGWLEYTDGDRFIETQSNSYNITHGDEKRYTDGFFSKAVLGESWELADSLSFDFKFGSNHEFFFGTKIESVSALAIELFLGFKYEGNFAASVAMNAGFEASYNLNAKYEASQDIDVTLSGEIEQEANEKILFKVDPDDSGWEKYSEKVVPWIMGGGAALMASVGGLASLSHGIGDFIEDQAWQTGFQHAGKTAAAATSGLSGVLYLYGLIHAIVDMIKRGQRKDEPRSQLLMDEEKIELKYEYDPTKVTKPNPKLTKGMSQIRMESNQITLENGDLVPGHEQKIIIGEEGIVLQCGKSAIALSSDGEVHICGNKISLGRKSMMPKTFPMGSLTLDNGTWDTTRVNKTNG